MALTKPILIIIRPSVYILLMNSYPKFQQYCCGFNKVMTSHARFFCNFLWKYLTFFKLWKLTMIRVVEILNQNKLIRILNKFALFYLFFKSENKPNIIVKNREIPIFCHIWKWSKGNNSLVFQYFHTIFFKINEILFSI